MLQTFVDWLTRRNHVMNHASDRLERITTQLEVTIKRNERATERLEQVLRHDPLEQLLREMDRRASEGNGLGDDNTHR